MNHAPFSLFNEFGVSLVRNGSWIGFSHEVEWNDGTEIRKYGWKFRDTGKFYGTYARIWIWKKVLVISGDGFKVKRKDKWGLKFIIGFEFRHS